MNRSTTQTTPTLSKLETELEEYLEGDARLFEREKAARRIKLIIDGLARHLGFEGTVKMFGSFSNGFKTGGSDLDIVFAMSGEVAKEVISILSKFAQFAGDCGFVNLTKIFQATVPILKFTDKKSQMEVDFCINNDLGVRNSLLLRAYCEYDTRVLRLGRVVKDWAKMNDLVGTTDGYLNSYAYMLLTIFYLQSVSPPVVPNLQSLGTQSVPITDTKWGAEEIWETKFEEDIGSLPPSQNNQSVGDLLIGFFRFFVETFDWRQRAVSMRLNNQGLPIDKFQLVTTVKEDMWYIEDPFDLRHNLAAKCTRAGRDDIIEAMKSCWSSLTNSGSWKDAMPAKPTSFFLKFRVTHTATPHDLLEEFEAFDLTKLYCPKLSDGRTGNAFLEFASAAHRRRAQAKNEGYVGDCQLQLHYSSQAALALAVKQNPNMYSTYEMASYKMRKQVLVARAMMPTEPVEQIEPVMPQASHNGNYYPYLRYPQMWPEVPLNLAPARVAPSNAASGKGALAKAAPKIGSAKAAPGKTDAAKTASAKGGIPKATPTRLNLKKGILSNDSSGVLTMHFKREDLAKIPPKQVAQLEEFNQFFQKRMQASRETRSDVNHDPLRLTLDLHNEMPKGQPLLSDAEKKILESCAARFNAPEI